MKRIFKQKAVPKNIYKEYLEAYKEELKEELIQVIKDTPINEIVNVEEKELYYFMSINVIF